MIQKGENADVNKAKMLLSPQKTGQAQCEKPFCSKTAVAQEKRTHGRHNPKSQEIPSFFAHLLPAHTSLSHQGPQQEIKVWLQQVMFYNRGFLPTILFFTSSFSGDFEMFQTSISSVLPSAMLLWPLKEKLSHLCEIRG